MNTYRKNAIIVGVLFITATVAGILSAVFSGPILDGQDYLTKVSANETQLIIGALLELIMGFAVVGIAIWLYPVLEKQNKALALGSVGARLIEGVFFLVGVVGLLSLLTLSQEFVKAGAPDASHFQTLGTLLLAVRDWAGHGVASIAFPLGALMYYYIFFQSKLIPRWLSGWGILGAVLSLAATLLAIFDQIVPFSTSAIMLELPIGISEMVLAVWLIVKGFSLPPILSASAQVDKTQ